MVDDHKGNNQPFRGTGEFERLREFYSLDLLETGAEARYDRIVERVARACDARFAAFSLMDLTRQWFKAHIGFDGEPASRRVAMCDHTIQQRDLIVVEDASQDARFESNPMVTAPHGVRFYASKTICGPGGQPIGTLCVFDTEPRSLSPSQISEIHLAAREIEVSLIERTRPGDQTRLIHARSMIASAMSNMEWLQEELSDPEHKEAIQDTRDALTMLAQMLEPEEHDLSEDTIAEGETSEHATR